MDLKLEKVFSLFLRKNYYYVDEKEVKLQLESHPDYPSLRAVTDTLDYLNIEHVAIQIPPEAIDQLPDCFLAMLNESDNQKNSLIAAEKKQTHFVVHNVDSKETLTEKEFKAQWSGVVVAIEPNVAEAGGSGQFFKGILRPANLLGGLLILSAIACLVLLQPSAISLFYLISSFAGLFVSILIVREELGQGSRLTQRICNASQATSCQEVLKSSGAKIYKNIGLSDLALLYFATATVSLFFGLIQGSLFGLISFITLPVIIYTIYYQGVVVKKWCTLCLTLSAVVAIQFVFSVLTYSSFPNVIPGNVAGMLVMFFMLSLAWYAVRSLIVTSEKKQEAERNLLKLKKDSRVFHSLLDSGKTIEATGGSSDQALVFGNEKAPIQITAVSNPMCGYCKPAFEQYDQLLGKYPDQVAVHLKFNIYLKDPDNPAFQVARRIVEIYTDEGEAAALKALRDWFDQRAFDKWQKIYGQPDDPKNLSVLEAHKEWSLKNDINYTPATILGNKLFPVEYKLQDLNYFIEDLAPVETEEKVTEEP